MNSKNNFDIFSKIANHSLPKWNDLPEIDLYMDQVIVLMEKYFMDVSQPDSKFITSSMINNYVKLGIMPAPIKKKYSREHLAYLIIICSLKQVMSLPNIKLIIDKKLKDNSIAEILDFYSNLYDFSFKNISNIYSDYLNSDKSNIKNNEDAVLFTAITATNSINISNKIFYINNPQNTSHKKKNS